jgi:hypothetical protein
MLVGRYREYHIRNALNLTLHAVDIKNRSVTVPSVTMPPLIPNVEIRIREHEGTRSFTNTNRENTPGEVFSIVIPLEMFLEGPVFVKEINEVLSLGEHLSHAKHPYSEEVLKLARSRAYSDMLGKISELPLAIIANDPNGDVNYLYTEIHGHICAAKVTHYTSEGETDDILMCYRMNHLPNGESINVVTRTNFRALFEQHPAVWNINGAWYSSSRVLLEEKLAERNRMSTQESISVEAHRQEVDRRLAEEKVLRTAAEESLAAFKRRAKSLEDALATMENVKYSERSAEHALRNLDVEESKAKSTSIQTVAKTIAVVIPVVWAIASMIYKK